MTDVFITKIYIKKLRHLKDVHISLSDSQPKHLMLTGINGSGKTSLLNAIYDKLVGKTHHRRMSHYDGNDVHPHHLRRMPDSLDDSIPDDEVDISFSEKKMISLKRRLCLFLPPVRNLNNLRQLQNHPCRIGI
jgi:ABC-type transport system involved in cytochrome bd biosynthesis fused ATPase/permease subunit